MRRTPIGSTLVFGLAVALNACAPPEMLEAEPDAGPPRRLQIDEWRVWCPQDVWAGTDGPREWVALPWAVNGTVYERARWKGRHLVVELSADGALPGHGPLGSKAARRSVTKAIAELELSAGPSPPVLIRTPQRTPWAQVAALLSVVTGDGIAAAQVQVDLAQRFTEARRLDLRLLPDASSVAADVTVQLTRQVVGQRGWVSLETARQRFEFPVDDDAFGRPLMTHGYPEFFDAVWWKVQRVLTDARGDTRAAEVRVVEEVGPIQLAYVVSLLDVLIDAGYRTVSFPAEGLRIHVEPPPPRVPYEPPRAIPNWVLLSSALGIVLAFAITIGSVGRTRRRLPAASFRATTGLSVPSRGRSRPGR